jgi:O-antigen ligase
MWEALNGWAGMGVIALGIVLGFVLHGVEVQWSEKHDPQASWRNTLIAEAINSAANALFVIGFFVALHLDNLGGVFPYLFGVLLASTVLTLVFARRKWSRQEQGAAEESGPVTTVEQKQTIRP